MDYQLGPGPLQVDQNTIDEKIKGDIGIVENGDVATHAIPRGYYVIWKGDLYVAKTDISSGTTLSTSNLTARPNGLGADVAALNSNAATYRNTDGKLISLSTSLNDVKTSGRYYATWQCTNTPTPDAPGYVDVYAASDTYIKQSFYDAYSDKVYTRRCENGTWSVWEQLALNSNTTPVGFDTTNGEKVSSFFAIRMRMGKLCVISGYLSINSQLSAGDVIVTLPFSVTNTAYRFAFAKNDGSGKTFFAKLNSSNQIVVDGTPSDTGRDQYYLFDIVFFAN